MDPYWPFDVYLHSFGLFFHPKHIPSSPCNWPSPHKKKHGNFPRQLLMSLMDPMGCMNLHRIHLFVWPLFYANDIFCLCWSYSLKVASCALFWLSEPHKADDSGAFTKEIFNILCIFPDWATELFQLFDKVTHRAPNLKGIWEESTVLTQQGLWMQFSNF